MAGLHRGERETRRARGPGNPPDDAGVVFSDQTLGVCAAEELNTDGANVDSSESPRIDFRGIGKGAMTLGKTAFFIGNLLPRRLLGAFAQARDKKRAKGERLKRNHDP